MKKPLTEDQVRERSKKLLEWLEWEHTHYSNLLSRNETSSAKSGFGEPVTRRAGGVTWQEDDPYSKDVHVFVKVNESSSSRKAHQAALRDREIDRLQVNELIRQGKYAALSRAEAQFERVSRKPVGWHKVKTGLLILQQLRPELYERLPSEPSLKGVVLVMHRLVPGRFPNPPSS